MFAQKRNSGSLLPRLSPSALRPRSRATRAALLRRLKWATTARPTAWRSASPTGAKSRSTSTRTAGSFGEESDDDSDNDEGSDDDEDGSDEDDGPDDHGDGPERRLIWQHKIPERGRWREGTSCPAGVYGLSRTLPLRRVRGGLPKQLIQFMPRPASALSDL